MKLPLYHLIVRIVAITGSNKLEVVVGNLYTYDQCYRCEDKEYVRVYLKPGELQIPVEYFDFLKNTCKLCIKIQNSKLYHIARVQLISEPKQPIWHKNIDSADIQCYKLFRKYGESLECNQGQEFLDTIYLTVFLARAICLGSKSIPIESTPCFVAI